MTTVADRYQWGAISRTPPRHTSLRPAKPLRTLLPPALGCPATSVRRFTEGASDVPGAPPAVVAGPQGLVPAGGPFRAPQPLRTEGGPLSSCLLEYLILPWKIQRDRISPKT